MTGEPLMLSDTAMVLLRQYTEAWQDYKALDLLFQEAQRTPEHQYHNNFDLVQSITARRAWVSSLSGALAQELWYLWYYGDIPVIRHLNWHLMPDQTAMRLIDEIFSPTPMSTVGQSLQDVITNMHVQQLGPVLMKAYLNHMMASDEVVQP